MVLAGQRRAATRVRGTRSLGRRGLVPILLPCLLAAAGHAQPGPSPAPEPALLPEGGMVWQVPVEEGLAVEIEHALGRVQVQGGAPGRIVLRARPSVAGVELRIVREPGVLKLATQGRRDDAGTAAAGAPPASLVAGQLEVDVPPGHAVRLRATSAQIEVDGLRAPELAIGLLAGSLRVRAELARLRLDLVQASADLDLGRLEQADLATVSGPVRLRARGAGRVQVRSVSAGLDLDPGALAEALRIETVAGPVRLAVAPGPGAGLELISQTGDLWVRVPQPAALALDLATAHGRIESAAGTPLRTAEGGWRLRQEQGSARLRMQALSADLHLHAQ